MSGLVSADTAGTVNGAVAHIVLLDLTAIVLYQICLGDYCTVEIKLPRARLGVCSQRFLSPRLRRRTRRHWSRRTRLHRRARLRWPHRTRLHRWARRRWFRRTWLRPVLRRWRTPVRRRRMDRRPSRRRPGTARRRVHNRIMVRTMRRHHHRLYVNGLDVCRRNIRRLDVNRFRHVRARVVAV